MTCGVGDIIKNTNNQYAVICRCNVLGTRHGYIICCFDGPNAQLGHKCAIMGSGFNNWTDADPNTGTISITTNTTQVTGTNTLFTSEFTVGDKIILGGKQGTIQEIVNNTTLILTQAYTGQTLTNSNIWNIG